MDHLSAAGSSATRNLTTTEPSESLNRRKTVDFRFQRPYATSGSFFFNKPMRAMDSRRDFTSKKVFSGYFSELGEKANSALPWCLRRLPRSPRKRGEKVNFFFENLSLVPETSAPKEHFKLTAKSEKKKRVLRFLVSWPNIVDWQCT